MVTTTPVCGAKDPTTCRFHGAVIKMQTATANKDFNSYLEARQEVDSRQPKTVPELKQPEPQKTSEAFTRIAKAVGYRGGFQKTNMVGVGGKPEVWISTKQDDIILTNAHEDGEVKPENMVYVLSQMRTISRTLNEMSGFKKGIPADVHEMFMEDLNDDIDIDKFTEAAENVSSGNGFTVYREKNADGETEVSIVTGKDEIVASGVREGGGTMVQPDDLVAALNKAGQMAETLKNLRKIKGDVSPEMLSKATHDLY